MAKRDFLAGVIALSQENPERFLSLIRDGWPEIQAAIDQGHTLKVIHQRLVEAGVRMTYRCFTLYVRRLRRDSEDSKDGAEKAGRVAAKPDEKLEDMTRSTSDGKEATLTVQPQPEGKPEAVGEDPYETIREHLNRKPSGFHWDEDVPDASKFH